MIYGFRDKIVVVVATVTDDQRVLEIPKMTVAALRFTETLAQWKRSDMNFSGCKMYLCSFLILQSDDFSGCKMYGKNSMNLRDFNKVLFFH